jgi:acyl carrier protein
MTTDEARAAVIEALADIAPECDPAGIEGDVPLQQQLGLDSMDLLNLLQAVADSTGVEVPERDYDAVATLDGLAGYLAAGLTRG